MMSRPLQAADPRSIHPAQPTVPPVPPAGLLEAYKKHVEELNRIEDRQNKIIALILGILSAAGTLLSKSGFDVDDAQKAYFSLVALVVAGIGQHAINELHDMRIAVRDLLVRCEIGLGFYEVGAFLAGKTLYTDYEWQYPTRGAWMKQNYWIVWLVCAGFLVLLLFGKDL
jgi:hypothetical protein